MGKEGGIWRMSRDLKRILFTIGGATGFLLLVALTLPLLRRMATSLARRGWLSSP